MCAAMHRQHTKYGRRRAGSWECSSQMCRQWSSQVWLCRLHACGQLACGKYSKAASMSAVCSQTQLDALLTAGLCHDLGHGPFSHVFDSEFLKRKGITDWCVLVAACPSPEIDHAWHYELGSG